MAKSNEKVKTTEDIMFELAKPFPREEIQWRVQTWQLPWTRCFDLS